MARILVAEDDPSVRAFVVSALTMKGHDVVAEEDGGLAAETMEAEGGKFDLLLSDIKMPVMDGIALALQVGAAFPDVTIVLVYDVIVKPFTLAELLAKVDDALEGRPVEVLSLARQAREE
jgi:DNA-binding response OmpR family regulator